MRKPLYWLVYEVSEPPAAQPHPAPPVPATRLLTAVCSCPQGAHCCILLAAVVLLFIYVFGLTPRARLAIRCVQRREAGAAHKDR